MSTIQPDEDDVSGSSAAPSPVVNSTPSPLKTKKEESPRRSGRKVRQRILYGHQSQLSGAQGTPQQPRAKKTKVTPESGSDDEEEGNEEAGEQSSVNKSSDDSDLETPVQAPTTGRGRKRAAETSKATPVAKKAKSKQPSVRKSSQRKSRKSKGSADAETDENQGTLFDIVKAGKGALRAVVDDWIESYTADKENGMVDLIHFFVQCCGCKGTVTPKMLEEEESVNAIRQLTEQFDEASHEYPLIMTGPAYKKFRTNFVEFVDSLVQQCQHSIIYDEYMLDTLVSWLIRLSDSQVRAFRHTSTLAGMKLVSALIQVAKRVHVELDNTQRQLDSESSKVSSKKAMEKIEMLNNRRQELRQNVSDLEDMMNFVHQGMFVHRYRDSRHEIRALCIAEMGHWMKEYSSYFLSDKFLKYTVWSLHDKIGEVRQKAINSLRGLYEVDDFLSQLEPLTERFKERLVAMTLDKENEVAVEAVKLVNLLLMNDKLEEEECQQVEFLVFCTSRNVAKAAGEFLKDRLVLAADEEMKRASKSKRGKKAEQEIKLVQLKKLIEFFIVSEVHNHAAYLVDSLWESMDLLKDWKLMTDILLDKSDKQGLNDSEEMALIDIMVCACKQASTRQGPPGRAVRKVKENKSTVNEKKDLSAHFMQTLPGLLNKFGTDIENVTNLVSLPQYFDLEEYGQRRLGKYLNELLKQLSEIVEKHSNVDVLDECGKSFRTLTDNDFTLASSADVAKSKLIDSFVAKFKENVKSGLDAILELTFSSMQMLLVWSLTEIDINEPDKHEMRTLKKRVNQFMSHCDELIQFSTDSVQRVAFCCICDLLIIFAKQLKNRAPTLAPLVYEADHTTQVRLRDYVISHVFIDLDEDETEDEDEDQTDSSALELSKKRTVLAGFCKLVAYNVIDMKLVSPIFAFLIRAYSNYGDIIRHTMTKCRDISNSAFAKALLLSLQQEFEKFKDDNDGTAETNSKEFSGVKELARRFALSVGVDTTKPQSRECVVTLHREGIKYSLRNGDVQRGEDEPPNNLQFLDVLNEFTFKLIAQDKAGKGGVLSFLDENAKGMIHKKGGQWSPLISYRNGLTGQDEEEEGQPKGSRAKRKLPMEGDESKEEEGISKQNKTKAKQQKPKAPRGRPQKSTTSTAQQTVLSTAKPVRPVTPVVEEPEAGDDSNEDDDTMSSGSEEWSQEDQAPLSSMMKPNQTTDKIEDNTEEASTAEKQGAVKRKREETSQSDEEEDEDEEQDLDDQDFESPPASSQRSWLSSQKGRQDSKKARLSYSKKDTSGIGRTSLEDIEDEDEIEEYESEDDTDKEKTKAPVRARREKKELPDDFFDDSQEEKETEDESSLETAF
ncbi:cohesin subunit SA-2-like [Stylophora pistillata]|uniref:Cohesin subunit SA-1 n=1 Tax=Stylophora pistillata TaxID=50429 RepID=A0A2B4RH27_STYPI|nr:cohesin subunit SA-2-like [Stylophora pistillata]PFX16109.1 Cohesin subunit SA-1 [Stylophora pistillata]